LSDLGFARDAVYAVQSAAPRRGETAVKVRTAGVEDLDTIELTSPAPRLCPDAQPYISPTATLPEARGRGVGHALVDAALDWARAHGYRWVSVDFESANLLSRPFWLGAGFRPTGYGAMRTIDPRSASQ
jgi:GNAT superfamily N-acetyltransferase